MPSIRVKSSFGLRADFGEGFAAAFFFADFFLAVAFFEGAFRARAGFFGSTVFFVTADLVDRFALVVFFEAGFRFAALLVD